MKKIILLVILLWTVGSVQAQEDDHLWLSVIVQSAFIRTMPTQDVEPSASTFEGERLEAIGRNADGTWFEVVRPYREGSIGWISRDVVSWTFSPTELPMTDTTTGVTGATPIVNTGVAAFVLNETLARTQPVRTASVVMEIPASLTIPVIGRNADGSWLLVNYLGTTGWVADYLVRSANNLLLAPEIGGLPAPALESGVIPPEIQREQVQQLREYVTAQETFALSLAFFWSDILVGEVLPCEAPDFITEYQYSFQDTVELPELRLYVPRVDRAIEYLNESVDALQPCGVFYRSVVREARADAINAQIILEQTLVSLDVLETRIIPD